MTSFLFAFRRYRFIAAGALLLTAFLTASLESRTSAAPQITSITPRGLQAGGMTTVTIDGTELLGEPRLVLPFAAAAQTVREGGTDARIEIDVTLDAAAPPGIYPLRVANAKGISSAVAIGVDQLPQLPFGPQVAALPAALHGAVTGSTVLTTQFMGSAGAPVVVEVEARRLGGALNPVIRLLNAQRLQLAWAQGAAGISGDARLSAVLPADGVYFIELHDALYRGDNPGFFRLKIGGLSYADMAYPLAAQRGAAATVLFAGTNLPPGASSIIDLTAASGDSPVPLPVLPGVSGGRPLVMLSDFPEVLEAPPADGTLQPAPTPTGINGRLSAAGEEDRFRVMAPAGTPLRFDVFANRVGSPLDGVLTITNEAGAVLASSDDRPGTTDPGLDFAMPADAAAVIVSLKDLHGRGGESYVYRVAVARADRPDFTLTLFEDRQHVPHSGAAILRVRANRAGYNGSIKLALAGLPQGVMLTNDEIPAGATDALVSLSAPGPALAQSVLSVVGTSTDPNVPLVRQALLPEQTASRLAPWLRGELGVAVVNADPIQVAWTAPSAGAALPLGSSVPLGVTVARASGVAGPVRLTLVTSQIPPTKMENNQQVPDPARTLRVEGMPTIAADQATGELAIQTPADLPEIPYDLAVTAELLGADNTTVLARAVTPAVRLSTVRPSFSLELAGEPKIDAAAGSGPTGTLKGKVVRIAGFDGEVTLALSGLPAEYFAPSLLVAADQTDFEFPVAFPFGTPQGAVAGIKLIGTSPGDAGTTLMSNNQLDLALSVVAGGPPPALYAAFEDESYFPTLLNEGDAMASIEPLDRYAGASALRVTPGARLRAKLPTLGLKIAETPAEGEYRFLRFAWKKRGGTNITLALNAGGTWGPKLGEAGPALRYLAGGDSLDMAALKVADQLPAEWTVVTRDLFADFGAFQLDGLGFIPGAGEYGLFDHVYLARSESDLANCPMPAPADQPLAIFEDQPEFVANLTQGGGTASLVPEEKYSGAASAKVTPDQKFNPALPGLGMKIRENPAPGEYRYLRFAWRKQGGALICLQLTHDGAWGPVAGSLAKFRYDAGAGAESYGAALRLDANLPAAFTVVTRDLFADFGEFTLTGLALSPQDGEFALFDHIYLGRTPRDFDLVAPAAQ